VVAPGARADLLLVEGDPLRDLSLLENPSKGLALVLKHGEILAGRDA
jgi:imidazolonepropionase-like amidohydrolase